MAEMVGFFHQAFSVSAVRGGFVGRGLNLVVNESCSSLPAALLTLIPPLI